jgi:hypothetical protein
MANETEIERLVVRLVGDDQGYKAMIQDADSLTSKLSQAMGNVSLISRSMSGDLSSVFALTQRFGVSGAIIGATVSSLAVRLNYLGNETRDVAKAEEAYQEAVKRGAEATGRSVTGNVFMSYQRSLRETTEFAKSKWEETKKAQSDAYEGQRQLLAKQAMDQTKLQTGMWDWNQGIWSNLMSRPGMQGMKSRFWEGRSAQESLNARQVQEQITAQQKIDAAKSEMQVSSQNSIESLDKETSKIYDAAISRERYVDSIDKTIEAHERENRRALEFAQKIEEAGRRAATANPAFYVRPGHELEDTFRREVYDPYSSTSSKREAAQEAVAENLRKADRSRLDEAHFFQMQILRNKEAVTGIRSPIERAGEEAFRMERYRGKTVDQAEEVRKSMETISLGGQKLAFNEQMRDAVINIDYFDQELKANLVTMNEEKQIAIDTAKAFELWQRANVDLVATEGERQKAVLRSNAAQQVALLYAREGLALQERWMLPQDRALRNMDRMRKIGEVGGFGEGAAGAWVKQEAMAEAYAQAHRYYTSLRLGQAYDAIGGPQAGTARALREYALGSQMIPEEQLKAAGAMKAKDEDMPKDVKDMAVGIRELVGLVRENKRPMVDFAIGIANFAGGAL